MITLRAASGNAFSKIAFGLGAVLLLFAPPMARPGAPKSFTISRFVAAILHFAPPRPARRMPDRQSRSEPQPAALRRSRRRIARVRSFSVRRLPTWPGATCRVLASRLRTNRAQSGRLISPDRTFRRRSRIGSRPCQRPQHRRFSARRASISGISWSTASAFSAIHRLISIMCR